MSRFTKGKKNFLEKVQHKSAYQPFCATNVVLVIFLNKLKDRHEEFEEVINSEQIFLIR